MRPHADSPISRWLPVLLWMAVIFVLSAQASLPRVPQEPLDLVLKKLAHLGEYAVLGGLLLRALTPPARGRGRPPHRTRMAALALGALYAMTDEVHQSLVPGRGSSAIDVGIDVLGATVGVSLVTLWWRQLTRRATLAYTDGRG